MVERKEFDDQLNCMLDDAEHLIPSGTSEGINNAQDWYRFELDLWNKGEEIRQLLLNSKKKPTEVQIKRILAICLNEYGKRGRQSFVLLLGKRQFISYAPQIAQLLVDGCVDGHAIDTLYKMGASEYVEKIEPFLNHDKTWIRKEAKRYILKYRKD